MSARTIRRVADGAWCFLAFAALWALSRALPGLEAISPAVLLMAGSILVLSVVDGARSPIILGIPALMLAMLLLPDERAALYSAGFVLAVGLAIAAWRWLRNGRLDLGRAIILEVAALVPAAAIPSDDGVLAASIIAGVGAIAIVVVSSREARVGIDAIMIAYCAAMVTPGVPLRSSLFALVVAAVILLLRKPGPYPAAILITIAVAAGKWYLPVLLAVAVGFAATRYLLSRSSGEAGASSVAFPFLSGVPVAALSAVSISPDAWARTRLLGTAPGVTALALIAGSLLVQPSLATMYAVLAIACLVATESQDRQLFSPALVVFVVAMTGLTAWSGVLLGSFPLPIPFVVTVLVAIGSTLVTADRLASALARDSGDQVATNSGLRRLTSAIVAGVAAAVVLLHPLAQPGTTEVASNVRLAAGESTWFDVPSDSRIVQLRISGGNVAGLRGNTVVGLVRIEGGEVRHLRIGDFADWGVNRREHFLPANNPRPVYAAGRLFGRGRGAFLSGSGLIRLDTSGASRIVIEALPEIGERGRLMIESVEIGR